MSEATSTMTGWRGQSNAGTVDSNNQPAQGRNRAQHGQGQPARNTNARMNVGNAGNPGPSQENDVEDAIIAGGVP